jgi:prevent-host-death family protein
MKVFTARDAKNTFGRLLDEAAVTPVSIEKHGRAVAVVTSARHYEARQAQLDDRLAQIMALERALDEAREENARLRAVLDPPNPSDATETSKAASLDEAEDVRLNQHDLSTQEGRMSFLWALHFEYQDQGLLMAVNHVWDSIGPPKAPRCEAMAARLGLRGRGKTALRHLLERFLEETLAELPLEEIPPMADYPDFESWNAICRGIFERADEAFGVIARRYEAILDGREPERPPPSPPSGRLITGPWRRGRPTPAKR